MAVHRVDRSQLALSVDVTRRNTCPLIPLPAPEEHHHG